MAHDDSQGRPGVRPPQRPGDTMPGTSQNIMATFYRDEQQTAPARRSWPLLVFPAMVVVLLIVVGIVSIDH